MNKFLLYIYIFQSPRWIPKFNFSFSKIQFLHKCTRIFYPFQISKKHVIRMCISNVSLFQNVYIFLPHTVTSSLCCMHFKSAEECCYVLGMYTLLYNLNVAVFNEDILRRQPSGENQIFWKCSNTSRTHKPLQIYRSLMASGVIALRKWPLH